MASSFRDPDGCLLTLDNRVLRFVNRSGEANLNAFLASEAARTAFASGKIVTTYRLDLNATGARDLICVGAEPQASDDIVAAPEHERITFQSFPYEWTPAMLFAAGSLTLDLAEACLSEGFGLKDATPYNVLFRSSKPVFVDLLSFERRDPNDPLWLPYAQFVRTFVLPLLANEQLGLGLDQIFLTRRDGLEPEEAYRLCGFAKRLRPPFLTLVSIPTWLNRTSDSKGESVYRQRRMSHEAQATFVLQRLFRRLRNQLEKAQPHEPKTSSWTTYMNSAENFPPKYLSDKEEFLTKTLVEFKPRRLLDVGCNTGHFSRIAAGAGVEVVAIDQDAHVVDEVWRQAAAQNLDILPLVVDLTRPSPAAGWRNSEHESFLMRAEGYFDAVLMIAVVHHMLVTERIPLSEILRLAAQLTTDLLLIEFVPTDDLMFRRLTRGREHLFEWLTNDIFRQACLQEFHIIRSQQLGATNRWIYLLRKKCQ